MAMQYTKWKPDTCECVLSYSWDDTESEDKRTHDLHTFESKCKHHQALADDACFMVVMQENQGKNQSIGTIQEQYPSASVDWSFDDKRKLTLKTDLDAATKTDLQQSLQSKQPDLTLEVT